MNDYLKKFRAQYPGYDDMSDLDLAKALHGKFYSDMPWPDFSQRIGLDPQAEGKHEAELRIAQSGSPTGDFFHQAAESLTNDMADKVAGVGAALVPGGKGYAEARDAFQQRTDDLNLLAPEASVASQAAGLMPLAAPLIMPSLGAAAATVGPVGTAAARNPVARRILGDWLPRGGLTYLLLDKMRNR